MATADVVRLVVDLAVAGLAGGGIAAWINARARRPVTQATAVERLNDTTLDWAERLKEDASDARREAREARDEAAEAHRQVRMARAEAEQLVIYLRWLLRTINEPSMDIQRLRLLVGDGPAMPPPTPPTGRAL